MMQTHRFLFNQPVTELIMQRHSVRTYDGMPIPESLMEDLRATLDELQGPFTTPVQVDLLPQNTVKNGGHGKLGTYGVIQGAPLFAAVSVGKDSSQNLIQLGYVFEQFILYLTGLGLGTCWLAGSFNKSGFAQAVRLAPSQILPIVSPIGYASAKKSLIDRAIKPLPNRVNRKHWSEIFFIGDLQHPAKATEVGLFSKPLEMVRLAPSAANKQPWRLLNQDGSWHFYLQPSAAYRKMFSFDIQRIDLGIAMCHFALAAEEDGLSGSWKFQPPQDNVSPVGLEYIMSWSQD